MDTHEIMLQLKRCESMCLACRAATRHFLRAVQLNPDHLAGLPFELRDIRDSQEDLDTAYLVLIFAMFEVALRDFWCKSMKRSTHPRAEQLLKGVSARRRVLVDVHARADRVREHRNSILHGGVRVGALTLAEARSYLCTYLSNLPRNW